MRILLLLLFFSYTAHAQTYENFRDRYYAIEDDSEKADSLLYYAEQTKALAAKKFGSQSIQYRYSEYRVASSTLAVAGPLVAKPLFVQLHNHLKNVKDSSWNALKADLYWSLFPFRFNQGRIDSAVMFADLYLQYQEKITEPIEYLSAIVQVAYHIDTTKGYAPAKKYYQKALRLKSFVFGNASAKLTHLLDSLINVNDTKNPHDFRFTIYVPHSDFSIAQLDSIADLAYDYRDNFSALEYFLAATDSFLAKYPDSLEGSVNRRIVIARLFDEWSYGKNIAVALMEITIKELATRGLAGGKIYADALSCQAEVLHERDFRKAIQLYERAAEIYKQAGGELDSGYIRTLISIAWRSTSDTVAREKPDAFRIMKQALSLQEKASGKKSIDYLRVKKELMQMYTSQADLDNAEKTGLEIYNDYLSFFKPDPDDMFLYKTALSLSFVYSYKMNSAASLYWHTKAFNVLKARNDTTSTEYLNLLSGYYSLYAGIGAWEKALVFLKAQEKYLQDRNDTISGSYLQLLGDKVHLYMNTGQLDAAIAANNRYLQEQRIIYAARRSSIQMTALRIALENQAKLQLKSKDFENLFKTSSELLNLLGEWNYAGTGAASSVNGFLGKYYQFTNRKDSSYYYLQRAADLSFQTIGATADYYNARVDLGTAYWYFGQWNEAEEVLSSAASDLLNDMVTKMDGLSEKEKQTYVISLNDALHKNYSLHHLLHKQSPAMSGKTFDLLLQAKGLLLNSSIYVKNAINSSNDGDLKKTYQDLIIARKEIAKAFQSGTKNTDSLIKISEVLEQRLSQRSTIYKEYMQAQKASFRDIRQKLQRDQAILDFVSFPIYNGDEKKDSTGYGVFVVKSDSEFLLYIPIEGNDLVRLAQMQGIILDTLAERSSRKGSAVSASKEVYKDLYKKLWLPVLPHLDGIEEVVIAADGIINKISFSSLQDSAGNFLSDEFSIKSVLSSRDFVKAKKTSVTKNIVLFGGANFNYNPAQSVPKKAAWSYLEGTLEEVRSIESIVSGAGWTVDNFTAERASETNFKKAIEASPSVIHLATHGFYFPSNVRSDSSEKNIFETASDPLMRTGLVFSSANWSWNGEKVEESSDDGILTAYELSTLDLSGVDLIVLSACETGIGDIQSGEGVYGLQRAIRQAGASRMILSLWPVPDKETSEMMGHFYTKLADNSNVALAFKFAQEKMRQKYPNSPALWAAFTLIE